LSGASQAKLMTCIPFDTLGPVAGSRPRGKLIESPDSIMQVLPDIDNWFTFFLRARSRFATRGDSKADRRGHLPRADRAVCHSDVGRSP
jgi:hypothetical protein